MGVIERDPYTGHGTTGHEWNGIKELNTAVPWPIWAFLIGSVAFAILWWILMPAWPLGTTYTKGLLGDDVLKDVAAHLQAAAEERDNDRPTRRHQPSGPTPAATHADAPSPSSAWTHAALQPMVRIRPESDMNRRLQSQGSSSGCATYLIGPPMRGGVRSGGAFRCPQTATSAGDRSLGEGRRLNHGRTSRGQGPRTPSLLRGNSG